MRNKWLKYMLYQTQLIIILGIIEDVGRMQLVPKEVHKLTGHHGGYAIWGK
jgi:hypothetical protein